MPACQTKWREAGGITTTLTEKQGAGQGKAGCCSHPRRKLPDCYGIHYTFAGPAPVIAVGVKSAAESAKTAALPLYDRLQVAPPAAGLGGGTATPPCASSERSFPAPPVPGRRPVGFRPAPQSPGPLAIRKSGESAGRCQAPYRSMLPAGRKKCGPRVTPFSCRPLCARSSWQRPAWTCRCSSDP